ncbi:MAG: MBL fold metallo-hydrolase, partial [Akkermansia sp.]|nr:MBL fold metallo-hydrolase [Akkermansia sp.]
MRFSVLASSSKGNATVICGGNTRLLVDTGISALRIRKGLSECGLSIKQIQAVLFTHEHTDHVCGLG